MNEPTCATCKFSEVDGPSVFCRRYPPAAFADVSFSVWPTVSKYDWCGEHQPEPKEKQP